MPITTRSAFTYGHTVTENNQYINFSEDGITELASTIEIGSYYLHNFINAVANALNQIGDNTYEVTVDSNRIITISADANFDLLVTTGTQVSISAFALMGFTTDRSGASSYSGDIASGLVYYPQAPLRDFVSFDDIEESVQVQINESSSGEIEVVSYGTRNFMKCNIKYATDLQRNTDKNGSYIENNPNGVSDLRTFMQYLRLKRPVEFVPSRDDFDTYTPCFLESVRGYSDGTGFELRELYSEGLAYHFETGELKFRKL